MVRLFAWGVHLFTASGVVLAFLALDAAIRGNPREALLWLLAALAIDGIDGTLARSLRVAERIPRIDGAALDLVVDYLTHVFVPVVLIWRAAVLPDAVARPLCAIVLLFALYVFVRRDSQPGTTRLGSWRITRGGDGYRFRQHRARQRPLERPG